MKILFYPIALVLCSACVCVADSLDAAPPRTFLMPATELLNSRESLKRGDSPLKPALELLIAEADQALALSCPSVLDH